MKAIKTTIAVLVVLLFSSCFRDEIQGTGDVLEESRDITAIDGIAVNIPAQIEITGNTEPSVIIIAQENIQKEIVTRIDGSVLVITSKSDIISTDPIIIKIGVDELNLLEINGSGSVRSVNTLEGNSLDIELTGSGDIQLNVNVDNLTAMVGGSGNISLTGEAVIFKSQINGSGDINSKQLICKDAYMTIKGSGSINTIAEQFLKVNINGSGNVIYYGNPKVESNISGTGQVIKK